jgi:hypothetical protein
VFMHGYFDWKEIEKGVLEGQLVTIRKEPQAAEDVIHILKEKQEQIRALYSTRTAAPLPLMMQLTSEKQEAEV